MTHADPIGHAIARDQLWTELAELGAAFAAAAAARYEAFAGFRRLAPFGGGWAAGTTPEAAAGWFEGLVAWMRSEGLPACPDGGNWGGEDARIVTHLLTAAEGGAAAVRAELARLAPERFERLGRAVSYRLKHVEADLIRRTDRGHAPRLLEWIGRAAAAGITARAVRDKVGGLGLPVDGFAHERLGEALTEVLAAAGPPGPANDPHAEHAEPAAPSPQQTTAQTRATGGVSSGAEHPSGELVEAPTVKLKGNGKVIVDQLVAAGYRLALADLGLSLGWESGLDGPWNAAAGRLNQKLRPNGWHVYREDGHAVLAKLPAIARK